MRKYFEGLTFTDGAFLFVSFTFGLFLRLFTLENQSPWTDELASWYFLRHLGNVFTTESHTPFYYLLLRVFLGGEASIFAIRLFSVFLSTVSIISLFFLAQKKWDKSKVVLFVMLLLLCPADIVYARMARHYSLMLEGSLVFYFLIENRVRVWIPCLLGLFLGFVHIFALIPITCILIFDYLKTKDWKRNVLILGTSCGVGVYYLARIIMLGHRNVGANVTWNTSEFPVFMRETLLQFFGDAYPRNQFYFVSFNFAVVSVLLALVYLLWRRKRSGALMISIWIASILFIEFVNLFWVNFRIARYVIYLSGFLILAVVDGIPQVKRYHLVLALSFSVYLIFRQDLITVYPWDDQVVVEYKEYAKQYPDVASYVCCNKFQSDYYSLAAPELCRESVDFIDYTKPLMFFDLNNNDSFVSLHIMEKMSVQEYRDYRHSRIILFKPR